MYINKVRSTINAPKTSDFFVCEITFRILLGIIKKFVRAPWGALGRATLPEFLLLLQRPQEDIKVLLMT